MWRHLFENNIRQQATCGQKVLEETASYLQLATLDITESNDIVPSCRTMCFRGFIGERYLSFSVDSRSRKLEVELQQSQFVEICSYFPLTKQQFRFRGKAFWVGPSAELSRLPPSNDNDSESTIDWSKERLLLYQEHTSDFMRANFAWECHPGHRRDRSQETRVSSSDIEHRLHDGYVRPFLRELRDYTNEKILNQPDLFVSEEERLSEMTFHSRALSHFFMLVIRVDFVDHVNLGQFPFERQFYHLHQDQADSKASATSIECIDVYP